MLALVVILCSVLYELARTRGEWSQHILDHGLHLWCLWAPDSTYCDMPVEHECHDDDLPFDKGSFNASSGIQDGNGSRPHHYHGSQQQSLMYSAAGLTTVITSRLFLSCWPSAKEL